MMRKDIIQKGLEEKSSASTLNNIEKILESINKLSPVEKLLLYLKLPTHNTNTSAAENSNTESSKSVTAHSVAINWMRTHLEENSETSLSKQRVYDEYRHFCNNCGQPFINTPEFGRLLRTVFPQVKPRRLGKRGCARYVYGGVGYKRTCETPQLPTISSTIALAQQSGLTDDVCNSLTGGNSTNIKKDDDDDSDDDDDDDDADEGTMARKSAIALVMEWSCKLLERRFDDINQLAQHLVVHQYVGNHSADAFTVLATSSVDDLTGSKLVLQDPPAGIKVEPSTNERDEVRNSLLKTLKKRSDIRSQKTRMEASRSAVFQGTSSTPSGTAEKKSSDPGPTPSKTAEVLKRKIASTHKTILPKLSVYNASMAPAAPAYQSPENQVNNLGGSSATMQPAQFVILSPTVDGRGGVTPASATSNLTPSLLLISSPLSRPQQIVNTKNGFIQNGNMSEGAASQSVQLFESGLSNSNKNATSQSDTNTNANWTFVSTKAQNLNKVFENAQINENSLVVSTTDFNPSTPLCSNSNPVTFSIKSLKPVSTVKPPSVLGLQTESLVASTSVTDMLHVKSSDENSQTIKLEPKALFNTDSKANGQNETNITPTYQFKSSTVSQNKISDQSLSSSVMLKTMLQEGVNSLKDSQLNSLNLVTSVSSPVNTNNESQSSNRELTSRGRGRGRSFSQTIKSRQPNKTVISLLRESQGSEGAGGEDGKRFQNDSRPVSELLRESRKEKQSQSASGMESAALLLDLVNDMQKKTENGKTTNFESLSSSAVKIEQIGVRSEVNPTSQQTLLGGGSGIWGNSSSVDLVNSSSSNVSLGPTLQLVSESNTNQPREILITLSNADLQSLCRDKTNQSDLSATIRALGLGNQIAIKLPVSQEQKQPSLAVNSSTEKINLVPNIKSPADKQRRLHPQLLQGSNNSSLFSSSQKITSASSEGGSQLARLLSGRDDTMGDSKVFMQMENVGGGLVESDEVPTKRARTMLLQPDTSTQSRCILEDLLHGKSENNLPNNSNVQQFVVNNTNGSQAVININTLQLSNVQSHLATVNNVKQLSNEGGLHNVINNIGASSDSIDVNAYMNSSVKDFTLQQLLENKTGADSAKCRMQQQIREQQLKAQQLNTLQQQQLNTQQKQQQLNAQQANIQQLKAEPLIAQQLQQVKELQKTHQQKFILQQNNLLKQQQNVKDQKLFTPQNEPIMLQILQQNINNEKLTLSDIQRLGKCPEVVRKVLASMKMKQNQEPMQVYLQSADRQGAESSRPASALIEQLKNLKSPAAVLSAQASRPSTVAAFTFDDLSSSGDTREADNGTPLSALLSPHTGTFTPLQLYDSLPMTDTLKPTAKVAPPANMNTNMATRRSSAGNLVLSQKSCFAPLSNQLEINLQSVPTRQQRLQSSALNKHNNNYVVHNTGQLNQNMVNPGNKSSANDTPGFAPVSSILPLKRSRAGTIGAAAEGVSQGRQRHRSAQEIHGKEGAAQIESIARMLQSSCDQMRQRQQVAASSSFIKGNTQLQPLTSSLSYSKQAINCASPFSPELAEINHSNIHEDATSSLLHRSLSEPSAQALLAAELDAGALNLLFDGIAGNSQPTELDIRLGSTGTSSINNSQFIPVLTLQQQDAIKRDSMMSLINEQRMGNNLTVDEGLRQNPAGSVYQSSGRRSRGDHMISGVTLNPLGGDFSTDSSEFSLGLNQPFRLQCVNATPPSSQNSSPEFGVEMIDQRTCFLIEPVDDSADRMNVDVNGVSLDTPNSIEANNSTELDHLFLNMEDGDWANN